MSGSRSSPVCGVSISSLTAITDTPRLHQKHFLATFAKDLPQHQTDTRRSLARCPACQASSSRLTIGAHLEKLLRWLAGKSEAVENLRDSVLEERGLNSTWNIFDTSDLVASRWVLVQALLLSGRFRVWSARRISGTS
jgi:hypothetical protein